MASYRHELKIPKSRVAVLIGKKGEVKKELEEKSETKIRVDSEEGDVFIEGSDPVKMLSAKEVVRAIGRGFNPEIAELLLKQDYLFELVEIPETKKEHLKRIKGRVIGAEGKARRTMEDLTDCHISVFGKTIALIGPAEKVAATRRAIEMLVQGSTHANVYKMLEKKKREGLL